MQKTPPPCPSDWWDFNPWLLSYTPLYPGLVTVVHASDTHNSSCLRYGSPYICFNSTASCGHYILMPDTLFLTHGGFSFLAFSNVSQMGQYYFIMCYLVYLLMCLHHRSQLICRHLSRRELKSYFKMRRCPFPGHFRSPSVSQHWETFYLCMYWLLST